MVTLCWAAKGGSGTTVVAASFALNSTHPSLLVDLDGELPAALGLPEPDRPGVAEWLATDTPTDQLEDLLIDIAPHRWLLPWRSGANWANRTAPSIEPTALRWGQLGDWLNDSTRQRGYDITIDAGTGQPPPPLVERRVDRSLLVTRPCYLALRRAVRGDTRPTGVVLVADAGRALSRTRRRTRSRGTGGGNGQLRSRGGASGRRRAARNSPTAVISKELRRAAA